MSIKIMSTVWEESVHKGSALLVMLALADHANDDGVSWPSIERLAERARIEVRQTQAILKVLGESGELFVRHGAGRSYVNLYLVTLGHTQRTLAKVLEQRFDLGAEEARQKSYAIVAKLDSKRVQSSAPLSGKKVQSSAERVQSSAEKVQSSAEKGAAGCTLTVINRQLTITEPEEAHATRDGASRKQDVWSEALALLRLELPRTTFEDRLRHTTCSDLGDGAFRVECRNREQAEFLTRRMEVRVKNALATVIGRQPVSVCFAAD